MSNNNIELEAITTVANAVYIAFYAAIMNAPNTPEFNRLREVNDDLRKAIVRAKNHSEPVKSVTQSVADTVCNIMLGERLPVDLTIRHSEHVQTIPAGRMFTRTLCRDVGVALFEGRTVYGDGCEKFLSPLAKLVQALRA
jgi:hypothetical protein